MPAYLMIDIDVRDEAQFKEYVRAVEGVIHRFGGRYLLRRQPAETLEGSWRPARITMIEFPSAARAREFWASADFQSLIDLRRRSANASIVLVEQPDGIP